ncbi:helix-turn-helix transcriptional regulator [Micromonospora rifamycinica]|uniref:helix-turn-helix domain-containing protein n=1 Tax=Micromonospora rifamycinica TaxID=291594 RepID=UPI003407F527
MGTATDYVLEELRLFRAALGLSQDDFGKGIGYSGSHVSSVETGGRAPTKEFMKAVDGHHQTGGRFQRMLERLGRLDAEPAWLREWIEFEREATTLRWFELAYVPGLLQTERYARATLAGGRFAPEDVDRIVASRLERQAILRRDRPPQLICVIDEAVLRRPVLEMPDGERVAHADNQLTAQIVDTPTDVATLARTWEIVRNEALPRRQSIELIKEVAKSWT